MVVGIFRATDADIDFLSGIGTVLADTNVNIFPSPMTTSEFALPIP